MLKRLVARLLIITQIYSNLFQGVAHAADLAESYPIRNEIHLHSSVDKHGSLRLALGTDGIEDSTELKWFDIPNYQAAKKLAPQIGLSQITEVEVDDENLSNYSDDDAYLSTDDESSFEREGITRNSQAAAFTLQGLKFSISNNGTMVIEGRQTGDHKPIFLNNEAPIILDGVTALALKITAPRVVNTGASSFKQLIVKGNYIEGEDEDRSKTSFINDGNLTAKELFLSSCNSVNHQTITATRFEINGELTSDGSLTSDELILEESAYLRLNEDSRADIKTLFLSKASHFENQQQAEAVLNIGVLYGSDGSLTNLGTMAIDKTEVGSAFQAITNRHFLDIAHGSIQTKQFENHGTFTAEQSDLQVTNAQNFGALKTKSLQVVTAFTNTPSGVIETSLVSGSGDLRNLGLMETQGDLDVNIKRFTNAEEARIEVTKALGFDQTTFVINQGNLVAKAMTLFANKTTQNGHMTTTTINLTGGGEFENLGDIDVDQDLNLEGLDGFINKGNMSTKLINGYENLITLRNDFGALFKVRDGPLDLLATTTNLINDGTIEAQLLNLNSDQTTLLKSGIFKAPSISLTGVNPFTNPGQIIADHLMATSELVNHGQLVTHRSTHLSQGLTNAAAAVADLKSLRVGVVSGVETPAESFFTQRLAKISHLPAEIDEQQKRIAALQALDIYPALTQKEYETEIFKKHILPKVYAKYRQDHQSSYEKYLPTFKKGYPPTITIRDAFEQSGDTCNTLEKYISYVNSNCGIQFDKLYSEAERSPIIRELTERQHKLEELQRQTTELLSDSALRVGDEIINVGTLRIIGVDTNGGVIKLTNGGTAVIDAGYTLPRLDKHSPENLARVATNLGPTTWENYLYSSLRTDHEFEKQNPLSSKFCGSKYLRLCNALRQKQPYVYDYSNKIEPEFSSWNGLILKQMASRQKMAFIKLYESEVAKSQTEGSAAEQSELQQYLKQFEPAYQQILASRTAYAKSQHPAAGSALVVESDQTPAVKLQLLNQTPGQLTLKSGKFEFVGNQALVNDGTLIQDSAYTLWLTSTPGDFNRGTWKSTGSLGLLGLNGSGLGCLQVEDVLHANINGEALKALGGLSKVQASRVIIQAPILQKLTETLERASRGL